MIHWVRVPLVLSVLLFLPGLREDFETPKTAVVRICGLAALAASLASWRELRGMRWSALDRAVIGWVAIELMTTVMSSAPLLSLFGEPVQREGLLTSLAMSGLYFGARLSIAVPGDGGHGLERALDVFLVAATIASAYALLQAAHLDPLAWTPAMVGGWPTAEGRPFATLGHPNLLGVVSAAATAGWWARAAGRGRWSWLRIGAGAICAAATLVTLSRGAWIGLAAGLALPAALALASGARPSARGVLLAVAAVVALAGALFLAGWGERLALRVGELFHPARGSGAARLEIWRSAIDAWVARPVLGWGPDTFALVFPGFQTPAFWGYEWSALPLHAHSIVLHTLATRGALGLACGVAWCGALLAASFGTWRHAAHARPRITTALGVLAAIGVSGLFGAVGVTGHVLVAVLSGMIASELGSIPAEELDHGVARPAADPEMRPGGWLSDGSPLQSSGDPGSISGSATGRTVPLLAALLVALLVGLLGITELESSRRVAAAQSWLARTADADSRAASIALERALGAVRAARRLDPADDFVPRLEVDAQLVRASMVDDPRSPLLEATQAARRALRLVQSRVENHVQLARVLSYRVAAGDEASRREAESELELAVRLAPANALILNECARMELLIGRTSRALEITRRATSLYPDDGASLLARARAEAQSGDRAATVATLRRAVASEWHKDEASRAGARAWLRGLTDSSSVLPPARSRN